jgi:hypothetical protein
MLQNRPVSSPLRAATDLGSAYKHVTGRPSLETKKWQPMILGFLGRWAHLSRNAEPPQGFDQAGVNCPIQLVAIGRQWMGAGQNNAIR